MSLAAIGPTDEMPLNDSIPIRGPAGILPCDGLSPTHPVYAAGSRIDPPASDAVAIGTIPLATAAALPPDESVGGQAVQQLDGAVVLDLEAFREFAHAGSYAVRQPFQSQH